MTGGWTDRLEGRDPSLALALAVLVELGDAAGVAGYEEFVMAFREAFLRSERTVGEGMPPELSGAEVRANLNNSVLPRLATDGWIVDMADQDWRSIHAVGSWWESARADRVEARSAMMAAARAGWQRRERLSRPSAPATGSVLYGDGLCKSFKRRRVVDEVTVEVTQGEIVGLLGPNGAGKTTTFYLLTGLIRPDGGRVRIDDLDMTDFPMYQRARRGVGYLAQEPSVFRRLTVEQNLLAILETLDISRAERDRRLEATLDELAIKHLRKSKAYALSGGERRRLEITRSLVSNPRFMLLDEPFAGVDPIAVHDIQTIVAGLRHRGIGVLITDHNVEQTLDIVDRAYIMFEGRVQASGTVRELVYNDEVAQVYLGPTLTTRLRSRFEAVA